MSEHPAESDAALTMTAGEWLGALADAWDLGYAQGVRDEANEWEPADNPYRTPATPPA